VHKVGGTSLGMGGVVTMTCNCGFPKPLMVPFSTDGGSPIVCPQCKAQHVVARIHFDMEKQQVSLGIGSKAPEILRADIADIQELSRGRQLKPS
jgi:hypothetical protein